MGAIISLYLHQEQARVLGEQHFQGGNLALHTVSSVVFDSLVQQSPLKVALILVWIRPPSHIPLPSLHPELEVHAAAADFGAREQMVMTGFPGSSKLEGRK